MKKITSFYLAVIAIVHNVYGGGIQIEVEQGSLLGKIINATYKNTSYYSFQGIPYAQAPVGSLRFKAPQPPLSWSGVRNATEHGAICPQVNDLTGLYSSGSEDCLFLNIYTPKTTCDSLLPVIFVIHGGNYKFGSGNEDLFGPVYLMSQDVVVVTINYRLGALGFLSLDNEDVPGNAGMKDQLQALKWVNKNVEKFCGNPNKTTILGQSAGGASVLYHSISPLSKGYFKRGVSMSGSPFCDWSIDYKPVERAFVLGKMLGFETRNKTDLLYFLQNTTYDKIINNTIPTVFASEEKTMVLLKMFPFRPVPEKDFGQERFLIEDPAISLKNGNVNSVDLLCGYTSQETLTAIPAFQNSLLATFNRYAEMLVPNKMLNKLDPDTIFNISEKIRQQYFGNASISEETMNEMVNLSNHLSFAVDIQRFIRSFPNPGNNSRYLYSLSCNTTRNYYGQSGAAYGLYAPGHIDDLHYLFEPIELNLTLEENTTEYKLVENITTLFANFAKCGNPTENSSLGLTWTPFNNETLAYADIGNTFTISTALDEAAIQFWQTIYALVGFNFFES